MGKICVLEPEKVTHTKCNRGSAIVIVLIMVIISFIIAFFEIKISKRIIKSTFMLVDKLHAVFGAESNMEKLKFYISTGRLYKNRVINRFLKGFPTDLYVDGRKQILDNHTIVYLKDSGSMLNISSIDVRIMRNLLILRGLKEEKIQELINSLLDWYDADSISRMGGAEYMYYKNKGCKYSPRNCYCVQSPYELRLIKGFNNANLFDFVKRYLIFSPLWHLNINTVDKYMLSAILGIPIPISKELVEFRKSNNGISVSDIERIAGLKPSILEDTVEFAPVPTFVIDIQVIFKFNVAGEKVESVILFKSDNVTPYRVIRWEE